MSARRLAPAEVRAAVSSSTVRRRRSDYNREILSGKSRRAIRDTDLHKLFKAGRVVAIEKADGSHVDHRLTFNDVKNCIVVVGMVKKMAAHEPQLVITDKNLAHRLTRELGAGWSPSTVRRVRRLCAAAGLEVHPVVSDRLVAVQREPEFQGSVWVLDRRRLALVENAEPIESDLNRGVANVEHTPSTTRARKAALPPVEQSGKAAARDGPPRAEASAAVKAALRELRSAERRRQPGPDSAQPTATERLDQLTLSLVAALFVERWKVRSDWGDAAALDQAAERALALRADPDLVDAARAHLARKLLGEQLRLEGGS